MPRRCSARCCSGPVAAAQQPQTIEGTAIDTMCRKPGMTPAEANGHTRDCARMSPCRESGYAVITADGAVYTLDEKGNSELAAALKASTKVSRLTVTVTGTDGVIAVASIALDQ